MILSKNIEKNIIIIDKMTELYKQINEDILLFKNPREIMYKCKSVLLLDDTYITIDNLDILETSKLTNEDIEEKDDVVQETSKSTDINIEERKSALVTIGKNKQKIDDRKSKMIKL